MKRGAYLYAVAGAVMMVFAFGLWIPHIAKAKADKKLVPPTFEVDPLWPKPLPDNWVTGEIGGTCIDAQDHLFIVTRGFQNAGLVAPEGVGGANPQTVQFARSRATPP